jgi:hypothetical protein
MLKILIAVPCGALVHVGTQAVAQAQNCTAAKVAEVLAPATASADTVAIDCDLTLDSAAVVTKRLILKGEAASGVTVDCNGAMLNGGARTINANTDMIEVRSRRYTDANGLPAWERLEDVMIKNCHVIGAVRIWGMGKNGEAEDVRESSHQAGHVARVQANAPRRITFDNMTITALGRTPFYVSPGVTYVTLTNSEITGESTSVGVYLDTESYGNEIRNNYLHVTSLQEYVGGIYRRKREELAIDNSSYNKIINNYFSTLEGGGIYIYRNCGEGGTVRHGTPRSNQIINNTFYYNHYEGDNPAIHIGSRGDDWWRFYCDDDDGYPWGSSVDDRSFAQYNVVMQNQIFKRSVSDMIKEGDSSNRPNYFDYNETVTSEQIRFAGCYVPSGYKNFILHGETIDVFKSQTGVPMCTSYSYTCNDGNLEFSSTSTCDVDRVTFDCQVSGDNNGCNRIVSCPSGRRIVGAVAACNLEYGSVTDSDLSAVAVGFIQVLRASDNVSNGRCYLGGTSLHSGQEEIQYVQGHSAVSMGCDEHDINGGDCHIQAALYCR